jgi:hypothetical protein
LARDQDPVAAIADAITTCAAPQHLIAKVRAKLEMPASTFKVSGKLTAIVGFRYSSHDSAQNPPFALTQFSWIKYGIPPNPMSGGSGSAALPEWYGPGYV